ncbi:MAG: membrane-bound O-acyltransferase family protein [Crocinitomicaceae bacterium]|nr:membrane-bound O-acyltransferase family protein [Crocinitomicaceae bacterium]
MLFNSIAFFIFLPIVFAIYWWLKNSLKLQNAFLILASYVFYGWWDWRFLALIIFSTLLDYFLSLRMTKPKFILSLIGNLGVLAVFKYYNFFVDSWVNAWGMIGVDMHASTMQIILPVGISFYTFQTLSYSIDIYRKKLEPTSDFLSFAAFVAFFPQLVAGPIERAVKLLPQLEKTRSFSYDEAVSGLRLILWGMFKKVVVADTCARYADKIFADPAAFNSPTLLLGVIYFTIQIYGDFSGYSDIAIGTSRLFGIKLSTNFKTPYFSRDIGEFWRRWHISLSTWFRDYLYIPLGGSRGGVMKSLRNVAIIFLVSGLWHGANWTFVAWGAVHAILFVPLLLTGYNRKHTEGVASLWDSPKVLATFTLVSLAWVFFRTESLSEAMTYFKGLFSFNIGGETKHFVLTAFVWVAVMLFVDWLSRSGEIPRWWLSKRMLVARWGVYAVGVWLCLKNLSGGSSFIYFQF